MTIEDKYLSIHQTSEGEYKEKGSKFLAFAIPCQSEMEAKDYLTELRKAHPNACHVCYAWRFGHLANTYQDRYSDDGEPSSSAGKPIFGQILSAGLTNILIAVVRYYGGTKLGVGGLINAYRSSAKAAIDEATIVEDYVKDAYELIFPYEEMGTIMNVLKKSDVSDFTQGFEGDQAKMRVAIRRSQSEQLSQQLLKIHTLKHKKLLT